MNIEIATPTPKLADFAFVPPERLKEFGTAYAPDMGFVELKHCQQYYLKRRGLPPSAEELGFLNNFVAQNYHEPDAFLISEMKTDDDFLAATFADLMAKRAALTPNYQNPCSLAEIPQIAAKYIAAQDKKASVFDTMGFSCEKNHMLSLAAQKITPTLLDGNTENGFSGGTGRSFAFICRKPITHGDKIYAILKSTDGTENFEEKLRLFAASPSVLTHVKKLCPIDGRGVLRSLTELGTGMEIELPRLYGKEAAAERLLVADVGMLLVVKASEASDVLIDALDAGLRPRLVGQLRKDEQVLLKHEGNTCFSFSLPFLKRLSFSRAYRTEMKPSGTNRHALLLSNGKTETIDGNELFLVRANADDSHHAALYATLYAVAACVAHGISLCDIRIAERIELALTDISPESLGKQLALLLGFYRAATELELTELNSAVIATQGSAEFTLYAVATEPKNPTPDKLVDTDSKIYLLEPAYDEQGNPDFEDLKKMFAYVLELRKDGLLLSAKAVVGSVLPVLEDMSRDSLAEYLHDEPYIAKAGSILIETNQNVQGLLLAKTCPSETTAEETKSETDAASSLLPEKDAKEGE